MSRPPRWVYLIAGILIVMSCLLGVTVVYVLLELIIPHGMDIQMLLLYIIVPLTVSIALIVPIFAFVLTRKKEQSLLV